MSTVKPLTPNCKVAVHGGSHHADDVFSIATLSIIEPSIEVIRTRDELLLSQADFRVDVGCKYDPTTGDYDHHQATFNEHHPSINKNKFAVGPKMAAFGLIMRHYGRDAIIAVIKEKGFTYDLSQIEYIYTSLDRRLVAPLDAFDNGEQSLYYIDNGAYKTPSILKFIQNFNPSPWIDPTDALVEFMNAVDIAKVYLKKEIIKHYGTSIAIPMVAKKCKECKDGILILDQYLPWSVAFAVRPEMSLGIKMVVYPAIEGGWMFQSPAYKRSIDSKDFTLYMANGDRRTLRYPAPSTICGKSHEELSSITGIPDAKFVHAGGFIGACDSLQGVLDLVRYVIDNQEPGSNTAPNR